MSLAISAILSLVSGVLSKPMCISEVLQNVLIFCSAYHFHVLEDDFNFSLDIEDMTFGYIIVGGKLIFQCRLDK